MNDRYARAAIVAAGSIAGLAWALIGDQVGPGLIVAGSGFPIAVLLVVHGRIGGVLPARAAVGGAIIGIPIALLSHGTVLAFGYAFFLGFADAATELLDALRIDPRLTAALSSPWILFLLAETVVVAPVTEELGKALGARWSRPASADAAFLAGVAAGAGFAVIENIFYALGGAWAGGPWVAILLGRLPGAAVHPLAGGLVMLGWWGLRNAMNRRDAIRLIIGGVAVHAVWNASMVAVMVADIAYEIGSSAPEFAAVSLSYAAALGAVAAAVLWRVTSHRVRVRRDGEWAGLGDGRTVAAWVVLSASLLVPVAMVLLAFPAFYLG